MQKAKVVKKPEGRFYQIGEEKMIFRLTAADTEGRHSVIERTIAPHFKSPPDFHAHADTDWSCYVLQGVLEFFFEDHSVTLFPHDTVYVPRNTFFRWGNPTGEPALALLTYTPGGFEEFFAEMADFMNNKVGRIDNYQETLQFVLKTQDKYKMYRRPK